MQVVSVTIAAENRITFNRVYGECVQEARPRQPGELAVSVDLPAQQALGSSTVYIGIPVWFLDGYLSDALRRAAIAFTVG